MAAAFWETFQALDRAGHCRGAAERHRRRPARLRTPQALALRAEQRAPPGGAPAASRTSLLALRIEPDPQDKPRGRRAASRGVARGLPTTTKGTCSSPPDADFASTPFAAGEFAGAVGQDRWLTPKKARPCARWPRRWCGSCQLVERPAPARPFGKGVELRSRAAGPPRRLEAPDARRRARPARSISPGRTICGFMGTPGSSFREAARGVLGGEQAVDAPLAAAQGLRHRMPAVEHHAVAEIGARPAGAGTAGAVAGLRPGAARIEALVGALAGWFLVVRHGSRGSLCCPARRCGAARARSKAGSLGKPRFVREGREFVVDRPPPAVTT